MAIGGGLTAVFAALNFLLGTTFRDFWRIWVLAATLVAPLFVLARFPGQFDETPEERLAQTRLYSALRGVADFVAAPVFLALTAIMLLYAGKILVSFALPKGEIGWIVVSFGLGTLALVIASEPFRPLARLPLRFLLRYWPLSLPVPIVLLALAVWWRIAQYGVTPERYLLVALGIVLALCALLQLPRRTRGDVRFLALVPALALLISGTGPWGAVNVSVTDQAERFRQLVATPGPQRSLRSDGEAKGLLRFLADYRALDLVAPPGVDIGGAYEWRGRYEAIARIEKAWGLTGQAIADPSSRPPANYNGQFKEAVLDTAGFDLAAPRTWLNQGRTNRIDLPGGGHLNVALDGWDVRIESGGATCRVTIPESRVTEAVRSETRAPMVVDLECEGRKVRLVAHAVSGKLDPDLTIEAIGYMLLLRRSDWP